MEGVVFVHKNQPKIYSLHTTRSWNFVGLDGPLNPWEEESDHTDGNLLARAQYGKDIIVGMIDSGILSSYYVYGFIQHITQYLFSLYRSPTIILPIYLISHFSFISFLYIALL